MARRAWTKNKVASIEFSIDKNCKLHVETDAAGWEWINKTPELIRMIADVETNQTTIGEAACNMLEVYKNREVCILDMIFLLEVCKDAHVMPPDWLIDALLKFLEGAQDEYEQNHKRDLIKYTRYRAVQEARRKGLTWMRSFEEASQVLSGTLAAGGEDIMATHYKEVKRAFKVKGAKTALYYSLCPIPGFEGHPDKWVK